MIQIVKEEKKGSVEIIETQNPYLIREALEKLLYVPDIRLKPRIIEELSAYLHSKCSEENYKIQVSIAFQKCEPKGFVVCQIDPHYTSYGRQCGTFGWLVAEDFASCKALIDNCEQFLREHKIHKLRGPINFPKGLGGIGIQVEGFERQMMYGVAFGDPQSYIVNYLIKLGFKIESEYTCMKVTKKTWDSGRKVDKGIKLRYLTLEEIIGMKKDVFDLGRRSFQMNFPDASGAEARFNEMIDTYQQVPASHYKLPKDFDSKSYSVIPEFIEAWESCDLENVVTWIPTAFDRYTNKFVGAIFSLPDLYEHWLGQPITRNNVDTAMVDKEYAGRGIFSALNNIGQLTCNFNGIRYYEGTCIWYNNKDAVNSIFPHCEHIRKHVVLQKRVK